MILMIFIGCANSPPSYKEIEIKYKPANERERELIDSFAHYWHLRIKGDMKRAFSYELPYQKYVDGWTGYEEKVKPLNKNLKIELKDINFTSSNVGIVTKIVKIKNRRLLQKDRWIYIDDRWYHKYHQNILPFYDEK